MAKKKEPSAARPYALIYFNDALAFAAAKKSLEKYFDKSDYETKPFSAEKAKFKEEVFTQAAIVSFQRPVGRDELVDMKMKTSAMEDKFKASKKRVFLIDPGYVSQYNVIHTSDEDDFHRIYLYNGIFAETILYFERLGFRPFAHTPSFYMEPPVITAFNDIRIVHTSLLDI